MDRRNAVADGAPPRPLNAELATTQDDAGEDAVATLERGVPHGARPRRMATGMALALASRALSSSTSAPTLGVSTLGPHTCMGEPHQ